MIRIVKLVKSSFNQTTGVFSNYIESLFENLKFPPLDYQLAGFGPASSLQEFETSSKLEKSNSVLDDFILLMGVPKSRVSPSRKRKGHKRYIPETIAWTKCSRCGEAKRSHRICTAHLDICAMREEEYELHMKNKTSSK